jgi:4-amino-4-deoxy-L-arabinose transferase-like glycosyltransferase
VSKFAPWSMLMIAALWLIGPRRWLRHELSPAIVWILLSVLAFSLAQGKRADYLLPAYPATAILAAYALVKLAARLRLPAATAVLLPVLMSGCLIYHELGRSPEAKSGHTQAAIAFARQVSAVVPLDERIVDLVKGYHPLLSLLRRHDGNRLGAAHLTPGAWVIVPRHPTWPARATSQSLPMVVEVAPKIIVAGDVALYRVGDEGVTAAALLHLIEEQYAWNFPTDRYRASRDMPSQAF